MSGPPTASSPPRGPEHRCSFSSSNDASFRKPFLIALNWKDSFSSLSVSACFSDFNGHGNRPGVHVKPDSDSVVLRWGLRLHFSQAPKWTTVGIG